MATTQGMGFGMDDAFSAALARNWWAVAVRGALAIILGLIALLYPGATMLSLVLIFAAYALVDGVLSIVAGIRALASHERWGWLLVEGVVDILAAAAAFMWPGLTVVIFVWLVAGWAIVTGVLELAAAFRLNIDHGRWWLLIAGLVSILYGIVLVWAPLAGAVVLTWWLGAYAIIFGVLLLALALRMRRIAA